MMTMRGGAHHVAPPHACQPGAGGPQEGDRRRGGLPGTPADHPEKRTLPMQQAMQLDLPLSPVVQQSWRVPLGAGTGLELAITLTRSGAEGAVTQSGPPCQWDDGSPVDLWRARINLQPPVNAELELLSRWESLKEDDIPVPGLEPGDSWRQLPFFVKPMAMVASELVGNDQLESILAVSRSLGLMARHLASCWMEQGVEAARRFPVAHGMRWYVYAAAVNDETGRVAQIADICPGLLILCKALADREAEVMADLLLELVVRGYKLGKILDAAQLAWAKAQKLQPSGCSYTRDEEYATQRLRIRQAPPSIPPWQLWAGVPGYLVAEDVPPGETERLEWFHATTGIWVKRAREHLPQEQLDGLFRFLSYNWRWAQPGELDRVVEWSCWMDHLVDYLAFTGRILRRSTSPRRLDACVDKWEEELGRGSRLYPPGTALETHGLGRWQGERAWFEPIRTAGALVEESRIMGHCVAAYAAWAVAGECVYAHGEIAGDPVTVEIKAKSDGTGFSLGETGGRRNRSLTAEEMALVREWLAAVNGIDS